MQLGTDRPRYRLRDAALVALSALALTSYLGVVSFARGESLPGFMTSSGPTTSAVIVTLTAGGSSPSTHAQGEQVGRQVVLGRQSGILADAGIDEDDATRYWLGGVIVVEATTEQIAILRESPDVASVEPEPVVTITDFGALPDPGAGNWGIEAVGADRVWGELGLTGAGVRVGHIDTGVDAANPTLTNKVLAWRDFVNGQPQPYDDNGHGTHTASTAVGRQVDGAPIGVAPDAALVVAKAIGASGTAPGSQLLAAAQWMADPDGDPTTADQPTVINSSWTAGNANDTWFRSVVRHWLSLGIVPVFAAGNTGPDPGSVGSPAAYPESFAVGAIDQDENAPGFSSRGPIIWQDGDGSGPPSGTLLTKPDIAAPGEDILGGYFDGYLTFSGTSMAAPHVAGATALLHQHSPGLSTDDVVSALTATARDLGSAGKDSTYGYGALDAYAAVVSVGATPQRATDATFVKTPPKRTKARNLTYGVALTGASAYQYRVDGKPWSTPSGAKTFKVAVTPGRHTISVKAVSTEGRVDPTAAKHVVIVDRAAPVAAVSWKVRGRKVVFSAKVRDKGVGVANRKIIWRIGKRTARGRKLTYRFPSATPRRVRLIVTDRAGNRRVVRRLVTPRRPTVARAKTKSSVRKGGTLKVSGAAVRSGRVKVTLVPVRRKLSATAALSAPAEVRRVQSVDAGRFGLSLPLRGLPAGRYRLRVATLGRLGRGERQITRTVRITER